MATGDWLSDKKHQAEATYAVEKFEKKHLKLNHISYTESTLTSLSSKKNYDTN